MKYTVALSILVASSIMLFQNCGQVSFSDAQASGANLKLTTVDTPPSDDDSNSNSNSNTSNNNSSTTTNSESNPPTQTLPPVAKEDDDHKGSEQAKNDDDHKSSEPKKECSHKDDPKHKHVDGEDDDDHEDDDNVVYGKCTVGPGKSKKLALVSEDDLDVQQAVGEDAAVCVTEKGCLDIASEKFGETSFKADIGFCKNGHHMKLTDKELKELVDKE